MRLVMSGVDEETAMRIFEVWREGLKSIPEEGGDVNVAFAVEARNART